MTTPATYRRSCGFLYMPEILRRKKIRWMPAETWISVFNLQIRNDSAVMQMLLTSLGENWLTIKSQILPITGNTLSCLGLANR